MNEHTISLVRESFDLIEPIAPQTGAMFYANLFEADPSLQRLLGVDTAAEGAKLMPMVAVVVARLDQPEVVTPMLENLGRRLAGGGAMDSHYDTARIALLKTLYQALGVAYNAEVEEAWVDVYGVLAAKVRKAATVPA